MPVPLPFGTAGGADPSILVAGLSTGVTAGLIRTVSDCGGGTGDAAAGVYNGGRFSDAKLDGMIQQIKVEMDAPKRDALINDALKLVKDEYYYLPLHHQIRPWAMRKNVDTVHRADDRPMPIWTTIK